MISKTNFRCFLSVSPLVLDMWHKLLTNTSFQDQSQIALLLRTSYDMTACLFHLHVHFDSTHVCMDSIMSMLLARVQPFPTVVVETARRFAGGYLVRLRTHQVTSPDAAMSCANQNGNLQYAGVIKCYPFWGGSWSNNANQWRFWGISLITYDIYSYALFGLVSHNDPWYSNWETLFLKPVKGKQTCKYRCYRRMWRDAILAEEQMWAAVEAILKQHDICIASLRRDCRLILIQKNRCLDLLGFR